MPVCLNCGRAIEPGKKFCNDCVGLRRDIEVRDLVELAQSGLQMPARRNDRRWLVIAMLVLCAMLVVGAYVLMAAIPSGSEAESALRASRCRKNIERLAGAAAAFARSEGAPPEAGTIDAECALVKGGYLEDAPRCPATERYYVLDIRDGKPVVICDSELEGHHLEQ